MALIRDKVNRLVPFVTCALFLGDDERGFVCRYAHGAGTEALFKWEPKSWSELSLRLPACADGRAGHGDDLVSVLPCRLVYEGRLIGALAIYHTVPACYSDEHRRVLGRVSEQAAAVIHNSTRYEQTRHESQTDALTALPNRRSFERQMRAGLSRAVSATPAPASSCSISTSSRRSTTPTATRPAIARFARSAMCCAQSCAKPISAPALPVTSSSIVLWDCSPDHEAQRVAEVQKAVSAYPFEPRPGVRVPLSISAGCARFPGDGMTLDELVVAADVRMYQDKADRRARSSMTDARLRRAGVISRSGGRFQPKAWG